MALATVNRTDADPVRARSQPSKAAAHSPAAEETAGSPAALTALLGRSDRGIGPAQRSALMRLQSSAGNRATGQVLARDWAVPPTVANPPAVVLTAVQSNRALRINRVMFRDTAEIEVIRDVLGISRTPSVVDGDFVTAVARYQAHYGLTPDGILGPRTSGRLSREITAESNFLEEAATGTQLRRTARRLHLRSLTSRTQGTLVHQGFTGPDMNPLGCITVRTGDQGFISLEYTGENSNAVNWIQFISGDLSATPPGAAAPVFQTGSQITTGGPIPWTGAGAARQWSVDAVPPAAGVAGSPFYDVSGGVNFRTPGRSIAMLDAPGGPTWLPVAQAFTAAGGMAAGATNVRLRLRFVAYPVRNNRARYRVEYDAITTMNTTTGAVSAINYSFRSGREVTALDGVHRTTLVAPGEYPGSPIN
jgi:peptidoglycan hydrolase-like protein with peptidoglycan-binding domain